MVILYTTHCPQCNVLEAKLKQNGINYRICDDFEEMVEKGMKTAPQLEICPKQILSFSEAIKWITAQALMED